MTWELRRITASEANSAILWAEIDAPNEPFTRQQF